MRIVVTGATGNVGTSLLPLLSADPAVDSVLGLARREPELSLPKVDWATADISSDELVPLLRGPTWSCIWPGSSSPRTTNGCSIRPT